MASQPFPARYWAFNPNVKPWPHDPARAKAKLAEAGVPNGFTMDMVLEPTPEHVRRGEVIQAQLGAVGIKVDLKPMDLAKGVQAFFRSKELMAANYRWTGRPDPDQTVRGMFHSTGFYNPGGLKVPRVEELMDRARPRTSRTSGGASTSRSMRSSSRRRSTRRSTSRTRSRR